MNTKCTTLLLAVATAATLSTTAIAKGRNTYGRNSRLGRNTASERTSRFGYTQEKNDCDSECQDSNSSLAGVCDDSNCSDGVCDDASCDDSVCNDGVCNNGICDDGVCDGDCSDVNCSDGECIDGVCTDNSCVNGECNDVIDCDSDCDENPIIPEVPEFVRVRRSRGRW